MRKFFIIGTIFLFFSTFLYANPADTALLQRVDSLVSYYNTDFSAEYTILQEVQGQGVTKTVAGVFRRDSKETYVIVIMEPVENKGQGYIKEGKTLWFYDPQSKLFNTTSNTARFQNTNARNSDFTRSTLAQDYKVVAGENGRLGRFNCRILTLEAVTTEVTYPKMKVWISEDGLLRKSEDYSLSGQLLRTSAIAEYNLISGRYVPKQILFLEQLTQEKTQITITKPSFAKVADSIFSKSFLETVNR